MENYGIKILGTGSYVPEKILTNADLEKMVQTSDEWITTRTGIKERHVADKKTATSDLAVKAAISALKEANMTKDELDVIIVATITPDMAFPSTACLVQKALDAKKALAFDVSAACSGFIYALAVAKSFIESGTYKNILLIGAETLTKVTDWTDRSTCVLFGDGAGAMVLGRSEKEGDLLSIYIGSDGSYDNLLYQPAGGSRMPATEETVRNKMHCIKMEGKEVFKVAVTKMKEAAEKALEMAGKKAEDLALLIPHQANLRIIEAIGKRMGLPSDNVFVNVHKYGNMSSATTIIAFDEARKSGKVKKGDLVELIAFGGGFTWGAALFKL